MTSRHSKHRRGTLLLHKAARSKPALPPGYLRELLLEEFDLRRRAQAALTEWRNDPTTARPFADFRAELIAEGLLDDDTPSETAASVG